MKVYELIAELLKYPAGWEVELEVVKRDYTGGKSPEIKAYAADLSEICSNTTQELLTLSGSFDA